ncbi:hypothetical protein IFM89_016829 [Coptis chinensis]|uniref:Co-chaperone HscB C-terminal oligomerisation domain-containing protein n=1 Tax=Coptis chinensis TaxID=261450 RepID=A0A835LIS4_9MAGN|nr:hypothetical protein IFM89_016829 [Coptis chinensis]
MEPQVSAQSQYEEERGELTASPINWIISSIPFSLIDVQIVSHATKQAEPAQILSKAFSVSFGKSSKPKFTSSITVLIYLVLYLDVQIRPGVLMMEFREAVEEATSPQALKEIEYQVQEKMKTWSKLFDNAFKDRKYEDAISSIQRMTYYHRINEEITKKL